VALEVRLDRAKKKLREIEKKNGKGRKASANSHRPSGRKAPHPAAAAAATLPPKGRGGRTATSTTTEKRTNPAPKVPKEFAKGPATIRQVREGDENPPPGEAPPSPQRGEGAGAGAES
jgi:hypothetical protein